MDTAQPAVPGMVRAPAAAGRFYSGDGEALGNYVDDLLDGVPVSRAQRLAPAYVVPHAGYIYSGPTAAHVYARLRRFAGDVRRVVLVGPAHYVPVHGCVVPRADGWATPLGTMRVDSALREVLAGAGVEVDDGPFVPEHSLEVQLPFLQRGLSSRTTILPVLVGESTVDAAADVIGVLAGTGALVLCSTDLSHYQDEASAQAQDARTAEAVLELVPERVGVRDACGVYALRGLLGWAKREGLRPVQLHRCTSADTMGSPDRVVGYAAFAFTRTS